MRLITILIAALLCTACAGQGAAPGAVAPDRLAAADEIGYGLTASDDEPASQSAGVTKITGENSCWRIQCDGSGETQWIVQRISGLKPACDNLRYTFVEAEHSHDFEGTVFTGIADYATGRWHFQDVSMTGWHEGYPDTHYTGLDIPPEIQPVSPDGVLYFAVIVNGPWAQASAALWADVMWNWDGPFLAAPSINGPGTSNIDGGPDWWSPQCGGLAVYRCYDEWDPAQAEALDGWYGVGADGHWLPETWQDLERDKQRDAFYAVALRECADLAEPPISPYSERVFKEATE